MTSAVGHWVLLALPFVVAFGLWLNAWRRPRPGPSFFQRNGAVVGTYLVVAVAIWMMLLILLPQLSMVELSFRPKLPPAQMGGPKDLYTLENYRYFLFGSTTSTADWNSTHLRAFVVTIVASVAVTVLDLVVCYPLAFYMAKVAPASRVRILLLLLILPYWVNEILRAFALRVIFGASGILNRVLLGVGLFDQPIDFLGNDVALYVGLTYAYVLLMMFPLYNAIESLARDQIEAARDLGAAWWRIHRDIVLPHAKPGIASGCTLVFMLCSGALAAPLILGGPRTLWFTPIVYDRFYQAFNWPQGSAYALVLLLTCVAFVLFVLRVSRLSLGEITK